MVLSGHRGFLVDEEEREVASRDGGVTMLVEAGAGTGKTSVLISRLGSILTGGVAPIDRVVAITFTEKAAAEMITRLRDHLQNFLVSEGGTPAEREYALQALANFENHRISTIHSFSSSLLRETPFEAGVVPDFTIVEETDEREIIDESWESWIESKLGDPESALYACYHLGLNSRFLKQLAGVLHENRDYLEVPENVGGEFATAPFLESLGKILDELEELAVSFGTPEDDKGYMNIRGFRRNFMSLASLGKYEKIRRIQELTIGRADLGSAENWGGKPGKAAKTELCRQLKEQVETFEKACARQVLDRCSREILEFTDLVEEEKKNRGWITFDDLLIKTRNLLRDNREIREFYKEKFLRILVDEFQDTDPLQAEIVCFLSEELGKFESDWTKCALMPGKLFLVGDPKQSIYSFRRADIEIYEKMKRIVAESGELRKISVNFRTSEGIIDWINRQFSRIIVKPETGDYQSGYVNLEAIIPGGSTPELTIVKGDPELEVELANAAETRIRAAEASARFIRELVDGRECLIRDRKGGERYVGYGDIAVLFRNYSYMPSYENAFRKFGIPFVLEGGRQFFERPEIREILWVLKAIDNPRDEIALAASLKSSLFGLSDEDLLAMKMRSVPFSYLESGSSEHPASEAFEILERLHREKTRVSVWKLLEDLYEASCIRDFSAIADSGERRTANLEKLLYKAHRYDLVRRGTLRSFIRLMETAGDDQLREPDAQLAEAVDEVRMMTFHKSKGLEFPVVVLSLPVGKKTGGGRENEVLFNRDTGIPEMKKAGFETSRYAVLKDLKDMKSDAEEARLLYVAATRARDMLVLPAFFTISSGKSGEGEEMATSNPSSSSGKRSGKKEETVKVSQSLMQKLLEDTIGDGKPVPAGGDEPPFSMDFRKMVFSKSDLESCEVSQQDPLFDGRSRPVLSVFTTDLESWRREREELLEMGGRFREWKSFSSEKLKCEEVLQSGSCDIPMRIGSAFHMVLSLADLSGRESPESLIRLACSRERVQSKVNEVRELTERALCSAVIRRALESGMYRREFPFSLSLDGDFYRGAVDLVFREGEGYVIVDYKTDAAPERGCLRDMEKYRLQGDIYRRAIEQLTGEKVKQVLFYFVRTDETIDLSV